MLGSCAVRRARYNSSPCPLARAPPLYPAGTDGVVNDRFYLTTRRGSKLSEHDICVLKTVLRVSPSPVAVGAWGPTAVALASPLAS